MGLFLSALAQAKFAQGAGASYVCVCVCAHSRYHLAKLIGGDDPQPSWHKLCLLAVPSHEMRLVRRGHYHGALGYDSLGGAPLVQRLTRRVWFWTSSVGPRTTSPTGIVR